MARSDVITERSVADLETVIQEKRSQRDELRAHGWITAARKTDRAIDAMRIELFQLRAKLTEAHPASATASTTLAQIIFRVLLMLGNILLADRLRFCLNSLELLRGNFGISRSTLGIQRKKQKISRKEGQPRSGGVGDSILNSVSNWLSVGEKLQI